MSDPNSLYPGSIDFCATKHWTGRFPLYIAGLGALLPTFAGLITLFVYIARDRNLAYIEWDFEIFFALLASLCFAVFFSLLGLIPSNWILGASNQHTFRQRQFVALGGLAGCMLTAISYLVFFLCGPLPSHVAAFEELFISHLHHILIALFSGMFLGVIIGWGASRSYS